MGEATLSTIDHSQALNNLDVFNQTIKMADYLANSELIPKHFQKKPADVMIAMIIASDMRSNPITIMQNLYVVHGNPAWKAQFVIAQANRCGVFDEPISFTKSGEGDSFAVTAHSTRRGKPCSFSVSIKMTKDEGWYTKNPKYKTMPELMLTYRAAVFLVRTHAPEVLMGYPIDDEVVDVTPESTISDEPKSTGLTMVLDAVTTTHVVEEPQAESSPPEPASPPTVSNENKIYKGDTKEAVDWLMNHLKGNGVNIDEHGDFIHGRMLDQPLSELKRWIDFALDAQKENKIAEGA